MDLFSGGFFSLRRALARLLVSRRPGLSDASRFERYLGGLLERRGTGATFDVAGGERVSATLVRHRGRALARRLAAAVRAGRYQIAPFDVKTVRAQGKDREVHVLPLPDLVLHGVLAQALGEALEPLLSPRVYSYRRGRSNRQAVADFVAFVRSHRRARPDPRSRGLFVLRRDVRGYSDAIPVDARSPLWELLDRVLAAPAARELGLVPGALLVTLRPVVRAADGALLSRVRGLPTGSPLVPPIDNLYLRSLDDRLARIPGAFYARYGDDFLFAHADAEVTRGAAAAIDEELARLGLETNERKALDLHYTGAARPSEAWPATSAVDHLEFLGLSIGFDGSVRLPPRTLGRLERELRDRLRELAQAHRGLPRDELGALVCHAANEALDPGRPVCLRHARRLRHQVTDRGQLAELDRRLELFIAALLTGRTGARAFREVPPALLRGRYGLRSLVASRNEAAPGEAAAA
jgi:hypothetical protein